MEKLTVVKLFAGAYLALYMSGVGISQTNVEEVLRSPDVPIRFENPAGAPLLIQNAHVKVITNAAYHQLVGLNRNIGANSSSHYTTYPTVTVVNNTNRRVTGFMLGFGRPGEQESRFVRLSGVIIEPYQAYELERIHWRPAKTPPDLHSPDMWVSGDARNLAVIVARVAFDDGTTWDSPLGR